MTKFTLMNDVEMSVLEFRLCSKYYEKLNYEGIFLVYGKEITAYWQRGENFFGWCLN